MIHYNPPVWKSYWCRIKDKKCGLSASWRRRTLSLNFDGTRRHFVSLPHSSRSLGSKFRVLGNPCHSLYHLTDRCQWNQWQPIMLIPPVIMCDDPAVTWSCGKYVRQYQCRRQMHQHPPAHAYHLPHPIRSSPPPFLSLLPYWAAALISPLSLFPPGYCV